MAFTLSAVLPLGSKSRVSHTSIHPGFDELYNHNDSRDRGGYNHHEIDSDSVFTIHTVGDPFTLEITTRAATQVLETQVIEREIDTTSTTVSLSVFSQ
jgi:hypothetical protein